MQDLVRDRGIETLYHFTKLENIASIMKHGIIPRAILDSQTIDYEHNDEVRVDFQLDANCLSIEHPNYKVFYSLRKRFPDSSWVVIGVDRKVLWEKNCAFCHTNAANASITTMSIDERKGPDAFNNLFRDLNGKPKRSDPPILPDKYPTDPQAEVLVFDVIEPQYFLILACEDDSVKEHLKRNYPTNIFIAKHKGYFSPRFDYELWA